jgi:prostaglandin-H2 D-isomerase / glutathione transferase
VVSYEPDDDVKEKKLVTLNSEVIPFYLEKLEDIARDNGGHLALGRVLIWIFFLKSISNRIKFFPLLPLQLTWADFFFAGIIDYLNYLAKQDLTANHENLRKVIDNVLTQEKVQEWCNNRPQTEI